MDAFFTAEEHGAIGWYKTLHTDNTLFNSRGIHAYIEFSPAVFTGVFVFHVYLSQPTL